MVFYIFAVILAFSSIAQSVPLPQYYYNVPQRMTYNTPQNYAYNTPQNYVAPQQTGQIQFTKEDIMEMVERTLDPAIWAKATNVDWSPVTNGIDWSNAMSFLNNADWAKTFSGLGIAQAKSY